MQVLKTLFLIPSFCGIVFAQSSTSLPGPATPADSILRGMEKAQADVRPQVPSQTMRQYRLSGLENSNTTSQVVAEIDFMPPSSKSYVIRKQEGSNRGQQIVRRILDHEVEVTAHNDSPGVETITSQNYDFSYLRDADLDVHACYLFLLNPKHKQKNLIAGQVWIDKKSLLIRRVEGDMVKTPSWWIKKVHLKLEFADVNGAWLQTHIEAVADVRIFGTHVLTSQLLSYQEGEVVARKLPTSQTFKAHAFR
jgi:hypothetical protein